MRDRARWTEAARNDPERLALDEFLAFTHPESSHRALLQMVEDLFEKFGIKSHHMYNTNLVIYLLLLLYNIVITSIISK